MKRIGLVTGQRTADIRAPVFAVELIKSIFTAKIDIYKSKLTVNLICIPACFGACQDPAEFIPMDKIGGRGEKSLISVSERLKEKIRSIGE